MDNQISFVDNRNNRMGIFWNHNNTIHNQLNQKLGRLERG
jgi:hypothetical protein